MGSFLSKLWNALKEQFTQLLPGPALTPKQQKQGPFGSVKDTLGLGVPSPAAPDTSQIITSAGSTISSVGDFLSYIAWIFHPLNLLRAVEFITGLILAGFGIHFLGRGGFSRRSGATSHPVIRRALSVTPAGRAARVAQGRRMGRHEGQREAARMEARQRETRTVRESSAVEREQINRRARQTARTE